MLEFSINEFSALTFKPVQLRYEKQRSQKRYRLLPEEYAKIQKYDEMMKADPQQEINRLKEQLAKTCGDLQDAGAKLLEMMTGDAQKEISRLQGELVKKDAVLDVFKKENEDMVRILKQWVPNPMVLPLRAVKAELQADP